MAQITRLLHLASMLTRTPGFNVVNKASYVRACFERFFIYLFVVFLFYTSNDDLEHAERYFMQY